MTAISAPAGRLAPRAVLDTDEARLRAAGRFVQAGSPPPLVALLEPDEQAALLDRGRALLSEGRFPVASGGRHYPWPLV